MPLLSPLSPSTIHEVLQELRPPGASRTLKQILDDNGASVEEIAETVGSVMRGAETAQARLAAAKMGAELHGLLETDVVKPQPTVIINIQGSRSYDLNPIFLPREIVLDVEPSSCEKEITNG